MKRNRLKLLFLGSSLLLLIGCGSTSRQLIGTTWIGDYERYEAENKHVSDLLQHGIICISFSKDSMQQCDLSRSSNRPPDPCRYFYLKYKQDSLYFPKVKESFVLKKRTDDCLELEHVEEKVLYYLKPYKE